MEIQKIFSKWTDYFRTDPKAFILSTAAIGATVILANQIRRRLQPQRRYLGNSENVFRLVKTCRNDSGKMETVPLVAHSWASKITGQVTEENLRKALVWVTKAHPLLYHKIVGEDWKKSYFDEIPESEITPEKMPVIMDSFQETDRYYTDVKWKTILQRDLDDPKLDDKVWPYFRVHCLQNSNNQNEFVLVISFLHAIEDAVSSLKFMEDLLFAMNRLSQNMELPVVARKSPGPSMDQLLTKYEPEFWFKQIWNKIRGFQPSSFWLKPQQEEEQEPFICPEVVPIGANMWLYRRTGLTLRSLPREFSEKLLAACRQNGVTVHGALSAAMIINAALILQSKYPELSRKFPTGLTVSHVQSISVRPHIKVSNNVIGMFVSGAGGSFKNVSQESPFWEVAKQVKQNIQDCIDSREFAVLWKMAAAGIDRDPTSEILNCGRMSTTEISNVGLSPHLCRFSNFQMEEMYFSPGLRMQGGLFFCGVTTMQSTKDQPVRGGNLCLTFGHVEPIITESEGILFAERVIETLQNVCGYQGQ